MKSEDCELLNNFNERYQSEVDERGHNIPKRLEKAKKRQDKKKIKEHETSLRISKNLQRLTEKCHSETSLSKTECNQLSEGIESWNDELEYWTNKWYIKPFVSKKTKQREREFVQNLRNLNQKICKKD